MFGVTFFVILGIVLWIVGAFWPAILARKKGYSFMLFFLISIIISWLLALIVVLILKHKNETEEDRLADAAAEKALESEHDKAQ